MTFTNLHSEKREDLNETGVYIIYHLSKENWFYIGSASKTNKKKYNDIGFLQRWRNHFSTLKRNIHFNPILQNTINKYGIDGLRFKIIEICEPKDCITIENKWLQYYIKNCNVYNINKIHPTKLGYITSEETKKKISQSRNKKKVYQFDFNGNLIKVWECFYHVLQQYPTGKSSIWRCLNNLQQTSCNYIWSYNNKFDYKPFNKSKKVYQFSMKGEFIKEWKSASEAGRELKIYGISLCCLGKRIFAGGFLWSFLNNKPYIEPIIKPTRRKKVTCMSLQGEFIKEYSSITEASKELNISTTNISNCCKNKPHCLTAGGYKWKYKN